MAKAAAAIKGALDKKTLTLVSHKMRMQKVFRFGSLTLALTVPQGSDVASMDEDDMLKVMKKVTNDICRAEGCGVVPSHGGGCVCTTPC